MKRRVVRSAGLLFAPAIVAIILVHSTATSGQIQKAVDLRLKKTRASAYVDGKKVFAYDPSWLKTFYKRRSYMPAWISNSRLRAEARDLAAVLRKADLEGLDPEDYSACAIESAIEWYGEVGAMDDASIGRVDVLLSDSYLHYASDLHSGRIDPGAVNKEWDIHPRKSDLACSLQQALDSTGVITSLARLAPARKEYENLKKALAFYRSLPAMKDPAKLVGVRRLAKGNTGDKVIVLRKRLATWLSGIETGSAVFNQPLEDAVRAFQQHNGIEADGVVGYGTIAALNRTREDCLQQILVNLERCRWLPDESRDRHIVVNIAGFELRVVENGTAVNTMRVVVGKKDHRTPVFSNPMTYLVFSPYWNVPQTIAAKEILPQIIKNVKYLKKEKIRVFEKEGDDLSELDPGSVDWKGVKIRNLRFRMEPGDRNSLGRIKFMFPNCNNVYLHDTPVKSLFQKSERQYSHGCVRIEEPLELAAYLLARDTAWVNEEIRKASARHRERIVCLPEPVQVHLQYITSWVGGDGTLQFRKDIYGWDDQVSKSLRGIPVEVEKPAVRHFASQVSQRVVSTSIE